MSYIDGDPTAPAGAIDSAIDRGVRSIESPGSAVPSYRGLVHRFLDEMHIEWEKEATVPGMELIFIRELRARHGATPDSHASEWANLEQIAHNWGQEQDAKTKEKSSSSSFIRKAVGFGIFVAGTAIPIVRGARVAYCVGSTILAGLSGIGVGTSSSSNKCWRQKAGPVIVRIAWLRRKSRDNVRR